MKGLMPANPQFNEDDLLVFVTRVLERSTNCRKYSIRPVSKHFERKSGYDASIDALYQVYMQFKVAKYAYQANSKFIKGRIGFGVDDTLGVMHFGLREPPINAKNDPEELQHNCLFRLSLIYPGRAIYVAPTFTDETLLSPLAIPWFFHNSQLRPMVLNQSTVQMGKLKFISSSVPILQNLVSIFPHAPVKTHKHSYAYNFSNEVSFHSSPKSIEGGSRSFLSLITEQYSEAIRNDEKPGWEHRDHVAEKNRMIIEEIFGGDNSQLQYFLRRIIGEETTDPFRLRWALDLALAELFGIYSLSLVRRQN